jgi:hypothetical protein
MVLLPNMNAVHNKIRRAYELLVTGANFLQSPLLLALRVYSSGSFFLPAKASFPTSEKSQNGSQALVFPCPR